MELERLKKMNFKCPKCKGELETKEKYTMFGKRYEHYCKNCCIMWDHFLTMGRVLKRAT